MKNTPFIQRVSAEPCPAPFILPENTREINPLFAPSRKRAEPLARGKTAAGACRNAAKAARQGAAPYTGREGGGHDRSMTKLVRSTPRRSTCCSFTTCQPRRSKKGRAVMEAWVMRAAGRVSQRAEATPLPCQSLWT